MDNAMSDPNPLATGPTKWRAEHCTTHHHGCDCREWEHAEQVGKLEADADDYREAMGELVSRLASAEAELAALRARCEAAEAALREYADPGNWEHTGDTGVARVWLEPGSHTPREYDGFKLAQAAIDASREGEGNG